MPRPAKRWPSCTATRAPGGKSGTRPAAQTLAAAGDDGSIRLWDAARAERTGVLKGHTDFVYGVAFHPDGRRVASASWDGSVRLWDASTGRPLALLRYPHKTIVTGVAFHPDGKLLASAGRDDCVRLWDVSAGAEAGRLAVPTTGKSDFQPAFSPRGDLLVCGGTDRMIYVWRMAVASAGVEGGASGALAARLPTPWGSADYFAFSPNGGWLAAASYDSKGIRICDLARQETLHLLEGHTDKVLSLAVSGDGQWLASGATDDTVRLWDASTWRQAAVLTHGSHVYGMAFSPDGKRLACACGNNTIRLWDLATRQTVGELHGHGAYVHSVAFSADGTAPGLRLGRFHRAHLERRSYGKTIRGRKIRTSAASPECRELAFLPTPPGQPWKCISRSCQDRPGQATSRQDAQRRLHFISARHGYGQAGFGVRGFIPAFFLSPAPGKESGVETPHSKTVLECGDSSPLSFSRRPLKESGVETPHSKTASLFWTADGGHSFPTIRDDQKNFQRMRHSIDGCGCPFQAPCWKEEPC